MRILKYILLLAILAIIGLTVYVATQPSEFEVERSRVIKAQKSVIFSYVNDYRNWEDFGSWKDDDSSMKFTYSDTTIGTGASYSWTGSAGEGKTTTIFEKENDSIAQKVLFSGNEGTAYLTFKDTVGGTKVTWHSKGKIGFIDKVYATFKGGAEKMIGQTYEKTLAKLNKVISYEINTYTIKVDGVVEKPGTIYFQHKVTCKISEVQKNVNLVLQSMALFFKENGVFFKVIPTQILYVKSMQNYVEIHLENHKRIIVHHTLKSILDQLPQEDFLQIHKSYIVNTKYITHIDGNTLYLNEISLPIARNRKEAILGIFLPR